MKDKFTTIHQFASENKTSGSSNHTYIYVVETLDSLLLDVKDVKGFRELGDVDRVPHTLQSLEQFETEWKRRYNDEMSTNLDSQCEARIQAMMTPRNRLNDV